VGLPKPRQNCIRGKEGGTPETIPAAKLCKGARKENEVRARPAKGRLDAGLAQVAEYKKN